MKEKIKRILDLVRAGKLTLEDAAPLLAALSAKLALQGSDRELIDSLLGREDMDTGQIAEHLMLLRGVRETPPSPPQPPRPPGFPFEGHWESRNWEHREAREQARQAARDAREDVREQARRTVREARSGGGGIEGMVERITGTVERAVETAMEGVERTMTGTSSYGYDKRHNASTRILRIEVDSEDGDSYQANIPTSLAPHLHKLIPTYGIKALEKSGFTVEALQLIIEADPPSGNIIEANDEDGNSVKISVK